MSSPSVSSDSHGSDPNLPSVAKIRIDSSARLPLEAEVVIPVDADVLPKSEASDPPLVASLAPDMDRPTNLRRHSDPVREDEALHPSFDAEPGEEPGLVVAERVSQRSWPFRAGHWLARNGERLLGVVTLIVLLSLISAIPLIQILTLGYLLECSRRVASTGRFWSGAVGVRKAARIGAWLLGTWLCLVPIQYLSSLWYSSFLLDPNSFATGLLRGLQITAMVMLVPHIVAAWYCGGRLRHFFWPIVAPFSIGLWLTRKAADSPTFRPMLNRTLGLLSPRLVEDICRAKPLTDWFLPAILLKGIWTGSLFGRARDGVWDFAMGLRLPHYFWIGLRGFVGTVAWLFVPTMLLVGISILPPALSVASGVLGVIGMAVVLLYLPFAQAHFAAQDRLVALFDVGSVRRAFRGAPLLHGLALFLLLALSLPLFLLKIEYIPTELLWLPALAFMVLMWPARTFVAWAYAKGTRRTRARRFFVTWPVRIMLLSSTLTYTFFVLLSQYIAWNGSMSMLEQHIVLVPAPFTRLPLMFY